LRRSLRSNKTLSNAIAGKQPVIAGSIETMFYKSIFNDDADLPNQLADIRLKLCVKTAPRQRTCFLPTGLKHFAHPQKKHLQVDWVYTNRHFSSEAE
jgi:hypothetical protein